MTSRRSADAGNLRTKVGIKNLNPRIRVRDLRLEGGGSPEPLARARTVSLDGAKGVLEGGEERPVRPIIPLNRFRNLLGDPSARSGLNFI